MTQEYYQGMSTNLGTPEPLTEMELSSNAYVVAHWFERDDDPRLFDLNAPYQRGSVWTVEQRRNLIKSLLMGLPVGNIVVSKLPWRNDNGWAYRIVDGKQRIEAVRLFVADLFTVPGWWFTPADLVDPAWRCEDIRHSALSGRGRRKFDMATMSALEFNAKYERVELPSGKFATRERTDEQILQAEAELFLLINFGGVAQTEEDRARAEKVAT